MPNPSQFNTDRTYPGWWTITFSNPPINMFFPTTIVELGALMNDLEADPSVKVVVFQSANPDFFIECRPIARRLAWNHRQGTIGESVCKGPESHRSTKLQGQRAGKG